MHSVFRLQELHLRDSCITSDSRATSGSLPLLRGNSRTGDASGDKVVSWHDSRCCACLSCSKQCSSASRLSHAACASHSSRILCSSSRWALLAAASASLHSTSLRSFSHCSASFVSSKCWMRTTIWASNALADDMIVSKIFCVERNVFLPKSCDYTMLLPSLNLAGLDLEGGYCYDVTPSQLQYLLQPR